MPQFLYQRPGVTTSVVYEDPGLLLAANEDVPILIGEGQETRKFNNVEIHRGSSNVADERRVGEDLSHLVDGTTRTFKTTYGPLVDGSGKGRMATNPADVEASTLDEYGNRVPLRVTYVDGAAREFMLETILPKKAVLQVNYFFKRTDTQVLNEDLTAQVPTFATWTGAGLVLTLSIPGSGGNQVGLALTLAASGAGIGDDRAVSGIGSNTLSIELRKVDNSIRTTADLVNLLSVGIPTSNGLLQVVSTPTPAIPAVAVASAKFTGGNGPSTNQTFKLAHAPIVDGSGGGVVTNLPSAVTATVNGNPVAVLAVDGLHGLVTLAQPVLVGQLPRASYYTNNYQDTFDVLPAENVETIVRAGFAPGREDFVSGIDYVLDQGNIHWGNTAIAKVGKATPGFQPFDGTSVTTTLADEKVYLRPCSGACNGLNTVFTLEDAPTDGAQIGRVTDSPAMLSLYVGRTPIEALEAGAKRVVSVVGNTKTVTLYEPPATGMNVYSISWRNTLSDHAFTLEVVDPGVTGQGTYRMRDELDRSIPGITPGNHVVTDAGFAQTGILWPHAMSDLRGVAGKTPAETVTLTFQDDGLGTQTQPPSQAVCDTAQAGLRFRATLTGVGPNSANVASPTAGKPSVSFVNGTACADNAAVTITGETIEVNIARDTNLSSGAAIRTLEEIVATFVATPITTTLCGRVVCELNPNTTVGTTPCVISAAKGFSGGADAVVTPYATRFLVSSSRTLAEANADGLGRTGGATTGVAGVGAIGYLGQTYLDTVTGFKCTIVDPAKALDYGYTTIPASYRFRPGDKLVFTVVPSATFTTSVIPSVALYGLRTKVTSTYGMKAGDTLVVNTYNQAGNEPKIGEFYYVDLLLGKSDSDYGVKLYTSLGEIITNYGEALPENRASLGAKLFFQNGGNLLGVMQVKREKGMATASDQAYMDAITALGNNLPGSSRKAAAITTMSTSSVVAQFLAKHLSIQAAPRNKGEARGFAGGPIHGAQEYFRALGRGLASERMCLVYPGGAILSVDINNVATEFAVDGSFVAAALMGLRYNPTNDAATSLTEQKLVGFSRLIKATPDPILDMLSGDGVCCIIEENKALIVRHYVSTSTDGVLRSEPTSVDAIDEARKAIRRDLKQFVAKKGVQGNLANTTIVLTARLKALVDAEILSAYGNISVTRDTANPMKVKVGASLRPMFSDLWFDVTFNVTIK